MIVTAWPLMRISRNDGLGNLDAPSSSGFIGDNSVKVVKTKSFMRKLPRYSKVVAINMESI